MNAPWKTMDSAPKDGTPFVWMHYVTVLHSLSSPVRYEPYVTIVRCCWMGEEKKGNGHWMGRYRSHGDDELGYGWWIPLAPTPDDKDNQQQKPPSWAISSDGENYGYTTFPTEDAAIAEGVEYYAGEPFYVGKLEEPPQPEEFFDCADWLECVSCQDDYAGEHAEDWDDSTKEQRDELNEEVRKVLAAWLDRHNLRPTFFNVTHPKRITPNSNETSPT